MIILSVLHGARRSRVAAFLGRVPQSTESCMLFLPDRVYYSCQA